MHKIQLQGFVYTGIMMALIMSFVSSAYVITKTVEAVINWTSASIAEYAATYRGGSTAWGNNLGLFELLAMLSYEGWAFTLTLFSLWYSFALWGMIEKRV
jgi:hypothetical protein